MHQILYCVQYSEREYIGPSPHIAHFKFTQCKIIFEATLGKTLMRISYVRTRYFSLNDFSYSLNIQLFWSSDRLNRVWVFVQMADGAGDVAADGAGNVAAEPLLRLTAKYIDTISYEHKASAKYVTLLDSDRVLFSCCQAIWKPPMLRIQNDALFLIQ